MKPVSVTCLFFLAICFLVNGCRKKENCQDYAPNELSISWTDYNSVSALCNYFGCHKKTAIQHYGDTLKVMGYIIPGSLGIRGHFDFESHISSGNIVYLSMGDVYNQPSNKEYHLTLMGTIGATTQDGDSIIDKFRNYDYGQKVYATVVLKGRAETYQEGICCENVLCVPIEVKIDNK